MTAASLASAGIDITGDSTVLHRLAALLEAPDPDPAIVTADNE